MKIKIHRGTKEIGGSCVEIIGEKSRIIIDIGIPLVDKSGQRFELREYSQLDGSELQKKAILPDVAGLYGWDSNEKPIDGVLISHAHLDHYGFYDYVNKDICFYTGNPTKDLIELTSQFTGKSKIIKKHQPFEHNVRFNCGEFSITPYLMDHSAFDAHAFLIEDGKHKIIYSGDFRAHGRKKKMFYWFLKNAPKDVDAILLEGTMFGRGEEKVITEDDIEKRAINIFKESKNITLLYLSSQNIDRLVSFYRAASSLRKTFIVDIYTAHVLKTLNRYNQIPYPSENYSNIKVFYPYRLSQMIGNRDDKQLFEFVKYKIERDKIPDLNSDAVMMVRPSMLSDLERMTGIENSTFIYSLWRGYESDKSYQPFKKFLNEKEISIHYLHTSGHGYIETLQKVVDKLAPKTIIPIHTFHPEKYSMFSNPVEFLDDGEIYDLPPSQQ